MNIEKLSLSTLVGQEIYVKIPAWKQDQIMSVYLVGVEFGGIWIESRDFMEEFVASTPHTMTQKFLQVFVPYAQILAIYHAGGGSWISEKIAQ